MAGDGEGSSSVTVVRLNVGHKFAIDGAQFWIELDPNTNEVVKVIYRDRDSHQAHIPYKHLEIIDQAIDAVLGEEE